MYGMLRRFVAQAPPRLCVWYYISRGVGDWQPRPKHRARFSKQALAQSRTRFMEQKAMSSMRQNINEVHGELQGHRSKFRRQCEQTAFDLVNRAGKGPAASAGQTMSTARHFLMLNEVARKALKSGRRERKNIFTNSKKWRG